MIVDSPFSCPAGTMPVPVDERRYCWKCLVIAFLAGVIVARLVR